MMFKLRIALGVAVFACILTLIVGLVQDVRWLTLSYRALISTLIFAVCGFFIGGWVENAMSRVAGEEEPKGRNVDITDKNPLLDADELINPSHAEKEFSPFTPTDFDQISSKE